MKNTRNFLYLACHNAKYFKNIYGVIGNYLSVIDSMYPYALIIVNLTLYVHIDFCWEPKVNVKNQAKKHY
jgi:hypothetical protein